MFEKYNLKYMLIKLSEFCNKMYQKIIIVFAITFLSIVSFFSLVFTAYIPEKSIEQTIFKTDTIFWVMISFFVLIFVIAIYLKFITKIQEKKVFLISIIVCFLFSVMLVFILNPELRYDPKLLHKYAILMQEGEFYPFKAGEYLSRYHFQLGLFSYIRILLTFFGENIVYVFRIINCVGIIGIVYSLHEICKMLMKKVSILYIYDLIICFCLPIFYFSTFFYGNILSLSLGLLAVMFQLRFFEDGKKFKYIILCTVTIVLSIEAKGNSMVFLIAIILQFMFRKNTLLSHKVLGIMLPLGCYLFLGMITISYYENITGMRLNHALPKTAHIAMGLQESDKAPGWYNGYPYQTHKETGYDTELTSQKSLESIQSSFNNFIKNPIYAAEFFTKKTISQWNNPTFQSFWIQYKYDRNTLSKHIFGPKAKLKMIQMYSLDTYEFLIYVCALICLLRKRKKYTFEFLELALIFVGGFMFQLFWEAKAMHTLPYFIILIPYASYGIEQIIHRLYNNLSIES